MRVGEGATSGPWFDLSCLPGFLIGCVSSSDEDAFVPSAAGDAL